MADWSISGDTPVAPKATEKDDSKGWTVGADTGKARETKPLDNAPDDGIVDSALKAVGTTVGKGISHWPGMIGDLNDLGRFIVLGGESLIRNKPLADVYRESDERMKGKPKTWLMQAPSGRDIYEATNLGEYTPESRIGKWAMAAGEAGLGAVAPGGGGAIGAGSRATIPSVALANSVLRNADKGALTLGTLSGGAGDAVTDITGSPGLGVVASVAAPTVASSIAKPAAKYIEPMFGGNERKLAAERTLRTSSDPEAELRALNSDYDLVPGAKPTSPEVTGDVKSAHALETARRMDQDFNARMVEQQGQQNQARLGILRPLASPEADPKAVSRAFEEHIDAITGAHEKATAGTRAEATRQAGEIPEAVPMETLGGTQRSVTKEHIDETRGLFDKLYKSIDPEGKLAVVADDITGVAEKLRKAAADRPMKQPSELANEMLDKAASFPRVARLQDIIDFDQSLTAQMRKAAKADDWSGHEQLVDLKRATKKAVNEAIENQHKFEQAAMQRGEMPWEKTLAYNLQRAVDHWYGSKAGLDTQGQVAAATGTGSRTVSTGAGSDRPGTVSPGIEGVPGDLTPNLDADAAQRLALANKGYGMWKDEKRPLDAAMARHPGSPDFVVPDAKLPAQIFTSGDSGYTNVQNWLVNARNDPRAIANLEAMATTRLREAMKGDEMLSQAKLDAWKQKYGHALRAIDEVSPGFSQRFDSAANATAAFDAADAAQKAAQKELQKSAFKRFIGVDGEDDLRALVGRDLNAPDSGKRVTQMVDQLSSNPEALEGYRKLVLDWVLGKVSTAARDADLDPVLSGAKLPKFVYENPTAIQKLFGDEGLDYMRRVSADMERSQRMYTMQKSAVGSDTAKYLIPFFQAAEKSGQSYGGVLPWLMAGVEAYKMSGVTGAASVLGAKGVKDFAEGLRARGIKNVNELYMEGLVNPELRKALLTEAMQNGHLNEEGLRRITGALRRGLPGAEATEREYEDQREGRASGGAVSDHSRAARHLVGLVEKVRKQTTERTKPLLEAHDSVVAHALELAGRSI